MRKRFGLPAGILLGLVIGCLLVMGNQMAQCNAIAADPASQKSVNCDIHKGACTKEVRGVSVTLDMSPKPVTAMKDLKLEVTLSGEKKVNAPYIDLSMPGMNMGPNRVELRPVRDNVFEGQGVIVRCPSGRRTWMATVTLPEVGKVEFVFDVIH